MKIAIEVFLLNNMSVSSLTDNQRRCLGNSHKAREPKVIYINKKHVNAMYCETE